MLRALDNHVGSVAVDAFGTVVAMSSPHGGVVAFGDVATGRSLGMRERADGCGIAGSGKARLIATSGRGAIVEIGPDGDDRSVPSPRSRGEGARRADEGRLKRLTNRALTLPGPCRPPAYPLDFMQIPGAKPRRVPAESAL